MGGYDTSVTIGSLRNALLGVARGDRRSRRRRHGGGRDRKRHRVPPGDNEIAVRPHGRHRRGGEGRGLVLGSRRRARARVAVNGLDGSDIFPEGSGAGKTRAKAEVWQGRAKFDAGAKRGPEGQLTPHITPHEKTGIGRWSAREVADLLKTRLKPDFDDVQGLMEEAIENGYKYLDGSDRGAIAEYVLGLPPFDNLIEPDTAAPATLPD